MVIRPDDRVATILRHDESLVDVLAALSPAFERLRNPAMRRVMARLVTVEQAARMAGLDPARLVDRLNSHVAAVRSEPAASEQAAAVPVRAASPQSAPVPDASAPRSPGSLTEPPVLAAIPAERRTVLDVRDELRAGNEPFRAIMAALRERAADGALGVRAIFEPVPLYAVMRRQGLAHHTQEVGPEDWMVWFYPAAGSAQDMAADAHEAATAPAGTSHTGDDVVVLDVRGLEPPEPMMRTLAALEQLPPGGTLVQLNERVPQFLLPLLEERGFAYEVREQAADLVRVFIRRRTV